MENKILNFIKTEGGLTTLKKLKNEFMGKKWVWEKKLMDKIRTMENKKLVIMFLSSNHQTFYIKLKEKKNNQVRLYSDLPTFYKKLQQSNLYTNLEFGIEITTSFLAHDLIDWSLQENQSLKVIKVRNQRRYEQIVTGAYQHLDFVVNKIEEQILNWSNNLFSINIDFENYKISLVYRQTRTPVVFWSLLGKQRGIKQVTLPFESKIMVQCIQILDTNLRELQESILKISGTNYLASKNLDIGKKIISTGEKVHATK